MAVKKISGDLAQTGRRLKRRMGALLLYFFLFPLALSVLVSLFGGHYRLFLLKLGGFGLLFAAAALTSRGIAAQIDYEEATVCKAPKIPYKTVGAVLLGTAVFYLGWAVGHAPWWKALFVAGLGGAGALLYYGPDPRVDKVPQMKDVNPDLFLKSMEEASETLESIENLNQKIHDERLHRGIATAVKKARKVLDTIAEDPKDLRTARKFLAVYIEGVEQVCEKYLAVDESRIDEETNERLYTLLKEVQRRFDRELERLRANDRFDLDVQIDALREQIKD
ncbi:5-bromo-4-chloroindolyl phosphate hydrolysis family protein [Hydrogenimonas sp. SS33]|uniref:5-bromo-4-chloroindolyl phosphate hydrolysis family protein n=1 Tax=Hydrogenimonas leucolamina TaxID=2954236 RepID=UPI00336BEF21